MPKPVRVRFAPSPTGYLNLGGLRSALFNFLYARHMNGTFILRIEDTDRARLVEGSLQNIIDSLSWLGIAPDEGPGLPSTSFGPYLQSERLKLYTQYGKELLNNSLLYKDFSTPERLEGLRKEAQAAKKPFKFEKSMALTEPGSPNDPFVLRFEIKPGPDVSWDDAVMGTQSWQRDILDDFIAIKSDGYPTYHFASVVDDHLMEITHVMRAGEWLASTPKHILLYEAFDWQPPVFAHLPPVLGPDKKAKLSKRHGAKSALEYRDAGYLPEAVLNYLSSLGFNDGTTQEIYNADELAKVFELDRIQTSPAVFDAERLDWMDGMYIRQLPLDKLAIKTESFWPESAKSSNAIYKEKVLSLVQERLKYLAELPDLTEFFFTDPTFDPTLVPKQLEPTQAKKLLTEVESRLRDSDFSEADLEERLRQLVEQSGIKTGQLFGLIRVAVTGRTTAPGLFETLSTLGKEVSLRRVKAATELL
jgi:glutamyl-tRNA synthetase